MHGHMNVKFKWLHVLQGCSYGLSNLKYQTRQFMCIIEHSKAYC